jgi:asparagine synthase (glutamine-hydrolysing)
MANAIAYRGPDDQGVWTDEEAGIAFGHRRLAVIDVSPAGHQPMQSHSGRFVISYNGEIYNCADLRAEIERSGKPIDWRGTSDTEVLLAAIDSWGVVGTLERLNGMFAFAVWDRSTRTLTLARDRMGEKPLYYGTSGGLFLFGSELKALQAHPAFSGELDPDAIAAMLRYDYIPAPRTIWKRFFKLEPAHYLQIKDGARSIQTPTAYWSLADCAVSGINHPRKAGEELEAELDTLLADSVRRRMVSDVPLGAFLSGGIDSSLIVALMQAQSSRNVRTFTIGFDDPQFDEAPKARAVAEHLGTDHTEMYVSPADALDVIPALPSLWDEPFGDSSQIPTYLLSKLSRRSVTVALSGDGGDELFGGYSRFQTVERLWSLLQKAPGPIRKAVAAPLHRASAKALVPGIGGRAGRILRAPSLEALYHWRVSRVERPFALVRDAHASSENPFGELPFLSTSGDKMMYADSVVYLPEDILTKVDRATMAVSLESRAPFLDHRVVEFAWTVPLSEKLTESTSKGILRRIGRRYLPDEILEQGKMGFCVPIESWLRGPLHGWAEELLNEQRLQRQGILNASAVTSLWAGLLAGKRRHERVVWNLLMLQAWLAEQGRGSGLQRPCAA